MGHTDYVLLLTKLCIPPPRPLVIGRARLFELAPNRPGTRLVLVSAPAGFGKTTFLAEWCRGLVDKAGLSAAWYLLDEGDNDPVRFMTYMAAALSQALGEELDFRPVKKALKAGAGADLEHVLSLLVNALSAAKTRCVLVLDDYQCISAPAVHTAVTFLVDHLPPQLQLAIGTRSDPPLQLSRLRVRDQLLEVRATDLRFTLAEMVDFFRATADVSLSEPEARAIDAYAEGWAAGLQLVALAWKQQAGRPGRLNLAEFLGHLPGNQHGIFDYLADEVFERLLPDTCRFLLETSVLNRLSGPLCDALTGRSDSAGLLDQLYRANLFVVALDEEHHWYRYHYLFGQFLRERLASEQPDLVGELRRRASLWYEQNGMLGEAAKLALAASDYERAARLMEQAPGGAQPAGETLSARELEVLRLLANGASNQDVAAALVISVSTAKVHVHRILDKLDARNRTEAVARARELGLL